MSETMTGAEPGAGAKRWKRRPEGSTWGDYGPDDQLGRLNELTPEKVKQGIAEVNEGRTFCLSLPLDYPGGNVLNPRRHPPLIRPTLRGDRPNWLFRVEPETPGMTDVMNDDLAILHLQYSTQWDGFAHAGALFDADGDGEPEPVFYNGYRGNTDQRAGEGRMPARFRACSWKRRAPQRPERWGSRHGGEVPARSRRDDRFVRALWTQAPRGGLRRPHAHHGRRWHCCRSR